MFSLPTQIEGSPGRCHRWGKALVAYSGCISHSTYSINISGMTECAMEANLNWGAVLPPKKTGLQTQPSTLRTMMLKATYEIWGRGGLWVFPKHCELISKRSNQIHHCLREAPIPSREKGGWVLLEWLVVGIHLPQPSFLQSLRRPLPSASLSRLPLPVG